MNDNLKLRFGAMSPTIEDQLKEQGFNFNKKEIIHLQKDAEAITRLRIRGLIPAGQTEKSFKKLTTLVADHIGTFKNITKGK